MDPLRLGQSVARVARSRLTRRAALASSGAGLASAFLDRLDLKSNVAAAQEATPTGAGNAGDNEPPAVPAWMRTPGAPSSPYGERAPAEESVVRLAPNPVVSFSPLAELTRDADAQRPLLRDPLRGHPGHRPERASAPGPWPGRAAHALHDGGSEALPVRLRDPLPGVRGEFLLGVDRGLDEPDSAALPRLDQQCRMDRGAAGHHHARGRHQAGWRVDAGGGGGCGGTQPQYPHRQGDGRCVARLCRQWRGLAALPGLPATPPAARLRGEHERQVVAPPEGGYGTLAHPVGDLALRRPDA